MKLDFRTIQKINVFEKATGARVKDCINETFIIEEGNVQKALKGVFKVERLLKHKVRVIGFSADAVKFVRNLIYPVKAEIVRDGDAVIVKCGDNRTKGRIFGRDKSNLKWINSLVGKYFRGLEVKVE